MLDIAVIGAGPAGLSAGRYFRSEPDLFNLTIFERSDRVGGTWVCTHETGIASDGLPVHSSMYQNLQCNLPKQVMEFPDFPFQEDTPVYMMQPAVLQYLEDYTAHFNLMPCIHFRTHVEKVRPHKQDGGRTTRWEVTVRDLGTNERTTCVYDGVVVCAGQYSSPRIPSIPGLDTFPGHLIHSHNYRTENDFANQEVLIVSGGVSGRDIGHQLSQVATKVTISNHSSITCALPENMTVISPVEEFLSDGSVRFLDGHLMKFDSVILCTGYVYDYAFLDPACGINYEGGRVTPLYKHLFSVHHPTMSFIGLGKYFPPCPHFSIQARAVVAFLSGRASLPPEEEMLKDEAREFQEKLGQGQPVHHAHYLGFTGTRPYREQLCQFAGCEPLSSAVEELYVHAGRGLWKDFIGFKTKTFRITSDTTWEEVNH